MDYIKPEIYQWVESGWLALALPDSIARFLTTLTLVLALGALVYGIYLLVYIILDRIASRLVARTKTLFDERLKDNKVFIYLARLIPIFFVIQWIPIAFAGYPEWIPHVINLAYVYHIIVWGWIIRGLFRSVRDHLKTKDGFRDKPLDSYLQVGNMLLFFIILLMSISVITGQSMWKFFTAMGAASAILMLVFKDTILGFVASIQVSTNDMVRIGDWIEMPKYNADGDVIEINLNTVKVVNWDKTITTLPTYLLITEAFKNWRGMQESGGRRIKRSINIKISSIRYLRPEEIDNLKKIQILKDYIVERQAEIDAFNEERQVDRSMPVNGRHMTNIGLFRRYVDIYGRRHPGINQEMTFLIRHLQPRDNGLPLELYMFTKSVKWLEHEAVMADIFDHLLAAIKFFGLEVFELPAGDDFRYAFQETSRQIQQTGDLPGLDDELEPQA